MSIMFITNTFNLHGVRSGMTNKQINKEKEKNIQEKARKMAKEEPPWHMQIRQPKSLIIIAALQANNMQKANDQKDVSMINEKWRKNFENNKPDRRESEKFDCNRCGMKHTRINCPAYLT